MLKHLIHNVKPTKLGHADEHWFAVDRSLEDLRDGMDYESFEQSGTSFTK